MDLPKFDALKLDETDFIVDQDAQNICFFPLPIFTRISEMLSANDFYNLAQTCRYMHWRMFKYGHLMLKHHNIIIAAFKEYSRIKEIVTIEGKPSKSGQIILPRPYIYIEYLHLKFGFYHSSPSIFDKMIDYVSEAKKRIKHYCIEILGFYHICTQQTFQDVNNLIEKLNPLHLKLRLSWEDHKLSVEIPNIKNIYSVHFINIGRFQETDFHMNPCAEYQVYTVQDLRDIVQEFIKNSRLQVHVCQFFFNISECHAMLETEWNLEFKKAGEILQNRSHFPQYSSIPLYASIPSEHGHIEIFIAADIVVIQRKETVIGQWKDFYWNVRSYR